MGGENRLRWVVWAMVLGPGCGGDSVSEQPDGSASATAGSGVDATSEGPMSTSAGTAESMTSDATGTTANATGFVFDVGGGGTTTGSLPCGEGGMGELEFSYIWIANSPQGTVSKIDTETINEVGRYQVRPSGGGSPSRTSVNLDGDVVVASRAGGVTKIFARPEDCAETNGMAGIQTSSGAADVLPYGTEECIAWYTDFSFTSERAIAWTAGELDPGTCKHEGAKVWVGATNDSVNLEILRLDGDDGTIENQIQIPGTSGSMSRSPYGGAVDAEDDFWVVNGYCDADLIEIRDDFTYEIIQLPQGLCAYGIAIDADGYVWIGGYQSITGRYDPVAQTWDFVQAQGLGIQPDANGRVWLGAYGQNGVYEIDEQTLQVLSFTPLPTSGQSKGVAVDFFGYVWVVSDAGDTVIRMDPDTYQYDSYTGLDSPYSYSDMTGWGLKNVAGPQG